MRAVFFIGLFMAGGICSAQTASVPTLILDSLIYETKLGRQCTQVTAAQSLELESLHKELNSYGVALKLSQSSNETLSGLLNNSRDGQEILALQFSKDISQEKRKTKRWKRIAIIAGIVMLVREGVEAMTP